MTIWLIAGLAIAGVLFRPGGWPEAIWACAGGVLLVLLRVLSFSAAAGAVGKGTDVYLFLAGMMLLAELARREGVFDWIAGRAAKAANGSRSRLFSLVYAAGVFVTVFLSNDATAVVLTPAVYASVKKARGEAQPYWFGCALVANAASFVLPISNPANLVVFGKNLPPLVAWLRVFALPSLISVSITYLALRYYFRKELAGAIKRDCDEVRLSRSGYSALGGIAATAVVLTVASAKGFDLGLPTCLTTIAVTLIATRFKRAPLIAIARGVSWSVIPLVAGLFVLVEGMNNSGASHALGLALMRVAQWPDWAGTLAASFGVAALCNVVNNLPGGLMMGNAVSAAGLSGALRNAVLIGVDLGPNLSVTGSLATVLWLTALRREGETIDGWTFFKAGAVVVTPALALATLGLIYSGRGT